VTAYLTNINARSQAAERESLDTLESLQISLPGGTTVPLLSFANSVAPLGLIGVVAALLASGKPMGFVAILGILALIGIITPRQLLLLGGPVELIEELAGPRSGQSAASAGAW